MNSQLRSGQSEEISFRSAWSAVSQQYKKPTNGGKWIHKVKTGTLYVRRNVENAADIIKWAKEQGFETTQLPSDMHVTIAYSKKAVEWPDEFDDESIVIKSPRNRAVEPLGDNGAVVLKFASPTLTRRWDTLCDYGCSWDFDDYTPHMTITWDAGDLDPSAIDVYKGDIVLGPEIVQEIDTDWRDTHVEKQEASNKLTILKVDETLGLVFGWAIICKQNGEDYFDTQDDHIPEDAMLAAAADFMEKRRTLKLMHKGEKQGTVIFAWPLTTEISKAMGVESSVTGLMIAVKPASKKIIRDIKEGKLTGFSIGGQRIEDEEIDD